MLYFLLHFVWPTQAYRTYSNASSRFNFIYITRLLSPFLIDFLDFAIIAATPLRRTRHEE
jgi:hypothetical protein